MQADRTIAVSGGLPDNENKPTSAMSLVPIPAMEIGRSVIKPAAAITQERKIKLYVIPVALKNKYT